MTIVVSGLLLLLGVAVYLRNLRAAWWLLLLRLAVLGLLVLVLVDAVISRHWSRGSNRVIVLVDRSASMESRGLDTLAGRVAREFPLPERFERVAWEFADSAGPGAGAADAARTRLGRALELAARSRPAAVVLVSDGQDNGERDPVEPARRAAVPVYAVGCGLGTDRNASAEEIRLPDEVYAGDTVTIAGRIGYRGLGGEAVTVRLNSAAERAALPAETAEREFLFREVFDRPGRAVVRLAVDSVPGESDFLDNELLAAIEVRPARVRVRYLTDRPHPGTRLVLRLLEDDPRLDVSRGVALTPGESPAAGEADVYILDNISGGDELVRQVAARVSEGAGALVVAGPDSRYGPGFETLLPGSGGPARAGEFAVRPGPAGVAQPWLEAIELAGLPPFGGVFPAGRAGETWLLAGDDSLPAVVARRAGRGRVVHVAGYPAWRWGFRVRVPGGTDPLGQLVLGAVRWLAAAGQDQFRLYPERAAFYRDEPVRVRMDARTGDGSPWPGLDARARLDTASAAVPMTENRPGEYAAELAVAEAGTHRVIADARSGDSLVGRAEADVVVLDRPLELARTGLNRGLLERLASVTGGEYFHRDSLPGPGFEPQTRTWQRGFRLEPRRTPWVYVLIALLFCLEWVLRRRQGLL
ncbi:VWA domain-containing protein [candidate division WOR-3 bacterium]|nr:VWA domain-containing protein [candidate division WOR-3 bacterium]